ncbi:MAG: CoA transferase [Burkholderiaceae bacterium]|nr:CoA transferase [Burkholderiaceae bacterium]
MNQPTIAHRANADLPLKSLTVVDLGQIYNGSYATFLMAMAGARVIKIEPQGGEHLRRRASVGGAALPFAMLNSNKQSATLNLKSERGRALLRQMVRRADVLLENFAPGTMDRLGLGWDKLQAENPRLIYASGSGYGLSGPYRDYPAMDLTVQAMAGVMSVTGFADRPPVKAGPAICDFFGGVHLYGGVMTALVERSLANRGRLVEVSMQEAVYASLSSNLGLFMGNEPLTPMRTGNRHGGLAEAPYNVYPTKDGYIAILCVGETHWKSLLAAMQRQDLVNDERFVNLQARVANIDAVDALVGEFAARYTKEALFQLLMQHRVSSAPVRDLQDVIHDPHMLARRAIEWIDHPDLGKVPVPNSPIRYGGSEPLAIVPSRQLGQDNDAVYGDWLGLAKEDIDQLRVDGVV